MDLYTATYDTNLGFSEHGNDVHMYACTCPQTQQITSKDSLKSLSMLLLWGPLPVEQWYHLWMFPFKEIAQAFVFKGLALDTCMMDASAKLMNLCNRSTLQSLRKAHTLRSYKQGPDSYCSQTQITKFRNPT